MNETKALQRVHPQGEAEHPQGGEDQPAATGETFGGKVGLRWDEEAAVTAFGQWPYFVEFLKTAGLFEAWGKDCPLTYSSPHAPDKREVLAPPRLGAFLDERKPDRQPKLLRGDAHGGTEQAMRGAEQRGLDYLFRLRQTTGVKRLIARLFASDDWAPAGQGWPGVRGELPLPGWSRSRKVIVWRRQVRDSLAFDESAGQQPRQLSLGRTEVVEGGILYEYAVRATSLEEKLEAIAQLYRDRGDAENNFDERKNPSGWTGSTTRDLKRSRVMAGVIALVYNGWGLFTRLTAGGKGEAITTRAAAVARPCAAYPARASDDADDHELARQGAPEADGIGDGQRVSQAPGGNGGAVGITDPLATDPELDFPRFPRRQSRRHRLPPRRLPCLTAGYRVTASWLAFD